MTSYTIYSIFDTDFVVECIIVSFRLKLKVTSKDGTMKYYLQRLGILVRRFWPMMFALTIYQVSVYVGLTVLLAMKQWRVHLEDDFFKVYLLAYIVMSLPLCVMQYSPNVYSPRNSNDLETLVNFIFAQVVSQQDIISVDCKKIFRP